MKNYKFDGNFDRKERKKMQNYFLKGGVGRRTKFSENSTYHLLLFFTPTFVKDYLLLLQVETKAALVEAKNVMI